MTDVNIHIPIRVSAELVTDKQEEEVLRKINQHSLEPLLKDDIFTFSGICSNDRMDSYLTRMDPVTTLKNYVEDLKRGIPLQEGHDIFKNPYGRSFDAEFLSSNNMDEANSVRGHWYVLRNLTINGVSTNDTIRAIQGGIIKDMSVGFGGNKLWYRCSSCSRDIFDWECPHIPGLEDENGRMTFSWIVDGTLREVSTVYNGATPGAYIDKARAYIQQGEISRENIVKLEREYQVRLNDGKRSIFIPTKEANKVDLITQIRQALKEGNVEKARIYEVLASEGELFRQPDDILMRNELGEQCSVDGIKQLKVEAEMGRNYVTDMIDKAVATRIKAQGDTFHSEKYKEMLVRVNDLEFIKDEIESYEKQAAERFTAGRQTDPEDLEIDDEPKNDIRHTADEEENIFDK